MDLRQLSAFIAIARYRNLRDAAQSLETSVSTLSRQVSSLEDELQCKLVVRGSRGHELELTPQGQLFERRAWSILNMVDRTKTEICSNAQELQGEIYIGAAECEAFTWLSKILYNIMQQHPSIHFHFVSGNGTEIMRRLDEGSLDFGLLIEPVSLQGFEHLQLPILDYQTVLMRNDSPLAQLSEIRATDLVDVPLFVPSAMFTRGDLSGWLHGGVESLHIVGTLNLLGNVARMMQYRPIYAIGIYHSIFDDHPTLCQRPLYPKVEVRVSLVWQPSTLLSPAAALVVDEVRHTLAQDENNSSN